MRRPERPFLSCPKPLLLAFGLIILTQLLLHHVMQRQQVGTFQALSEPQSRNWYRQLSSGSTQLMSYLLVLRLQLHDNQLAQHIRYQQLDYDLLTRWLHRVQSINPDSSYPVMLAARVYSQTRNKTKLRQILVAQMEMFARNPQLNWRWLAESSVIAKHQLGDLELALQMSEMLANQPPAIEMPRWARDIRILMLGDNNRLEDASIIILALMQSGEITDPDELRFLKDKLSYFRQKLSEVER